MKDRVLVGVAGGDSGAGGIRGFIAALDAITGREVWRFHTIPAPGEAGSQTWSGDDWRVGGAAVWVTGTYDAELNLTYWGIGNPDVVPGAGDKLYSDSIIALDADTGRLKWHYQFTPADRMDWDSAHVPVLVDRDWNGRQRRLVLMANKNGHLYVLDRVSGEFLSATPFVAVNWVDGFDPDGRPRRVPGRGSRADVAAPVFPDGGGTNWYPSSYSPRTGLFYIPVRDLRPDDPSSEYGAVRALDPSDGKLRWEFREPGIVFGGILTTASGLLFSGSDGGCRSRDALEQASTCGVLRGRRRGGPNAPRDPALLPNGDLYALEAATGRVLWRRSLGGLVYAAPISYAVAGKQYIAIAGGDTVFAFALRR